MVSIPLQPQNATPAAVFDEVPPPLRLNTYRNGDTVTADQADYPDIIPGRADWLLLTEETSVSVSGNLVSIAGNFEYPLSSGWNTLSTPWSAPIDWADARVSIRNGSTTLPLSQAIGQGWVEAELTAFDPATDAYSTIAANQPTPGQLLPWSGYLLFSNIDGFITFSPPPAPQPGEPASIESTLSSDIALAGTTVTIENTVRDVLGTVLDPQPPLEFTITPVANTTGPVPTIASNVVSLDPAARGSFDIQSLVTGTVVADTVTLTVMAPTAQKQEFADFSQNLNTASTSFASAIEALEGGDTAAASQAKADLQGVAASIDLRRLQIAAPFSPEGGFPPTLGQLVAAGYAPQPADTAYVNLFASIISEYETLIPLVEALDPSTATGVDVANLNAHATTLTGLLAQLQSSNPTLYGVTANSAQLTVLVGQLLPKVTQLLAEKGVASLTAAGVPDAPSLSVAELRLPTRSLVAGGRVAALGHMRAMPGPPVSEPRRVAALFSLAELMVAQNIQLELAKQIYGPAMKDAANMAILSALANLLQPFAGSNLCAAVSGAFLSGVKPGIPGSFLEGTQFSPVPGANQVIFVGPAMLQAVEDYITTNVPIEFNDLDGVYAFFKGLINLYDNATGVPDAYDEANVTPSSFQGGEGFICTDFGDWLVFDQGFPDVLGDCFICLSNIIIIHHDVATGAWSFVVTIMVR